MQCAEKHSQSPDWSKEDDDWDEDAEAQAQKKDGWRYAPPTITPKMEGGLYGGL